MDEGSMDEGSMDEGSEDDQVDQVSDDNQKGFDQTYPV